MRNVKNEDPLAVILQSIRALDEARLQEAINEAAKLGMSLEQALSIRGDLSKHALTLFGDAAERVRSGEMSLDMAIRAVRLAKSESISIDEAMSRLNTVHTKTQTVTSIANELIQMMSDAQIISPQQMQFAIINSESAGMLPGRVLLLNKAVSVRNLEASIAACLMLRQKTLTRTDVLEALKRANKKQSSLEQALFELGTFKQPTNVALRLSDLLVMSALLSESDLLECREISIVKNKSFKQIVVEQGLVDNSLLDVISRLQSMVASNELKPYSAGRALSAIINEGTSYQTCVHEEKMALVKEGKEPLILGQLLLKSECITEAGLTEVTSTDQMSNIKIGKMLLAKGIINEDTLVKALRIQSSLKFGYLSDEQAVRLMSHAYDSLEQLEVVAKRNGIYIPTHVQWSWV